MDKNEMIKNKIIVAAEDILRSTGINSITISDICKKCKISKNTFYKYFSSKEELIGCLNKDLNLQPLEAENMRDLIISNAKKLIFEKGYDGFDMTELSNMTGIGRTTLYSYFKNSTEIAQHILWNELKNREFRDQVAKDQCKNSIERLNCCIDYQLNLIDDKHILRLIIEMIANTATNENIKQGFEDIEEYSINNIIEAIELGKKEQIFTSEIDAKIYAKLTYMLSYGVAIYYFLHPDCDTYNELKSYLPKYIINSLIHK